MPEHTLDTIWGGGIGSYAFKWCSSLKSIKIPSGCTIGDYAFEGCTSLTTVELPEKLVAYREGVFKGCTSLKSLKFPPCRIIIYRDAFSGCTSMGTLKLEAPHIDISNNAFDGCTSLKSVELLTLPPYPASYVTFDFNIYSDAFSNCENIESVTVGSRFTSFDVNTIKESGVFLSCGDGTPASKISRLHFEDCPNGFSFGSLSDAYELYYFPLKELYVGRPLNFTGENKSNRHFIGSKIEKIEYGRYLKEDMDLGRDAHDNLKRIIYGDSIATISYPQSSVSEIYLRCQVPPTTVEWENWNYINTVVYVPRGTLSAYQNAEVWKNFWDIREWDSAVTGIESTSLSPEEIDIEVSGRQIIVDTGGHSTRVRVYAVSGALVHDGTGGTVSVGVPGLYIVRVGNRTEKLLVK